MKLIAEFTKLLADLLRLAWSRLTASPDTWLDTNPPGDSDGHQ